MFATPATSAPETPQSVARAHFEEAQRQDETDCSAGGFGYTRRSAVSADES